MFFRSRSRLPIGQRLLLTGFVFLVSFLWRTYFAPPRYAATDSTPGLTSRRYDVPPQMAATFASAYAVQKLGWKPAETKGINPASVVTLETPERFGLGHDTVTVACMPEGARFVRVSITAQGHGSGFKHIRELQDGMDGKLPSAP